MNHIKRQKTSSEAERKRLMLGEFYTPLFWAQVARDMISRHVPDWKEKCVVWDASCGTGNLTKGDTFGHLIESTLVENDIEVGNNDTSVRFVHDFLNIVTLPPQVRQMIDAHKNAVTGVVMLNNPPFGTATVHTKSDGTVTERKQTISNTAVKRLMPKGIDSTNIYVQFLFQMTRLYSEICAPFGENPVPYYVAVFTPADFWTKPSHSLLSRTFMSEYQYVDGFIFNKSEFSLTRGVGNNWAVAFTVWKRRPAHVALPSQFDLTVNVLERRDVLRNLGQNSLFHHGPENSSCYLRPWLVETDRCTHCQTQRCACQPVSAVPLTSNVNVATTISRREYLDSLPADAVGYLNFGGNEVSKNETQVNLFSAVYKNGHGLPVRKTHTAILRALVGFSVRRVIDTPSWRNAFYQYTRPLSAVFDSSFCDENHPAHAASVSFALDCVLFGLIGDRSEHCVSLPPTTWTKLGKTNCAEARNHFFFVSADEMKHAAEQRKFADLERDVAECGVESQMVLLLNRYDKFLSDAARKQLKTIRQAMLDSVAQRKVLHVAGSWLARWDAGWKQIFGDKSPLSEWWKNDPRNADIKTTREVLRRQILDGTTNFGFLPTNANPLAFIPQSAVRQPSCENSTR